MLDGKVPKLLRVLQDLRSIFIARPRPSLQRDLAKLGPGMGKARLAGGCWEGVLP